MAIDLILTFYSGFQELNWMYEPRIGKTGLVRIGIIGLDEIIVFKNCIKKSYWIGSVPIRSDPI
jgi:hypothetical protein